MPRKFTDHTHKPQLEEEFVEIWRKLDALQAQVTRLEVRVDEAEESIEELTAQE